MAFWPRFLSLVLENRAALNVPAVRHANEHRVHRTHSTNTNRGYSSGLCSKSGSNERRVKLVVVGMVELLESMLVKCIVDVMYVLVWLVANVVILCSCVGVLCGCVVFSVVVVFSGYVVFVSVVMFGCFMIVIVVIVCDCCVVVSAAIVIFSLIVVLL
jgi:hypothetical protein